MKKLHTSAFLVVAAALFAGPIMGATDASAAGTVTYKDFSTLNSTTLNNAFSYSKVYWTDNTTITVKKAAGKYPDNSKAYSELTNVAVGDQITLSSGGRVFQYITAGQTLDLLVENSTATDTKGTSVDVLIRVSGVNQWESGTNEETGVPNAYAGFSQIKTVYGSSAETHPEEDMTSKSTVNAGDPIIFWNETHYADSLLTVKFCKKGTYSGSDCTAADNTSISAAHWDFDVPNSSYDAESGTYGYDAESGTYAKYNDKYLNGNESVIPQTGTNVMYYDSANRATNTELLTMQNGFGVKSINDASFNGIYFANSVFTTATGLPNATWSYRYSGTTCGVGFLLGSAVPYVMPSPTKTVDKDVAKVGDTVTYKVKQEVPNNYSSEADIVAFMSLWSNYSSIPESKLYTGFSITDSFDSALKLPATSRIAIVNEKGQNVTSQFNVTISGQTVTASSKDTTSLALYGHTYTMTVPTTVVDPVENSPINNLAKTTYTPTGGTPTTLTSPKVETAIEHTVIVEYVDEQGNPIAEGSSKDYPHGDDYATAPATKVPDGYQLIATPDNAKGTVNKDITVTYVYRKIVNPNTADHGLAPIFGLTGVGLATAGLLFTLKRRR